MKRLLLLIAFITYFASLTFAQDNNSLMLIDLSLRQVVDTSSTKSNRIIISFKLNRADLTERFFIAGGTKAGTSDVIADVVPVLKRDNIYYFLYDNRSFNINGYEVYLEKSIDESKAKSLKFLTVYAQDKQGVTSEKLNLQLQ